MNSNPDLTQDSLTDTTAELAIEREAHAATRVRLKLLESKLLHFVPQDMISLLNKGSLFNISVGDQIEKKMTVLFTDIRDFTVLSENITPQQTFNMINSYLSMMNPIISAHHGIIDKYIGDAIMALFPTSSDDALSAALSMLVRLKEYNAGRLRAGYRPIRIGIGINTGMLILGVIGGGNRMEGTVIGHAVNLASRLEAFTKTYGTPLLISEHTFYSLAEPQRFSIRYLGRVNMAEKALPESAYEVFDHDAPEVRELKIKSIKKFEEAVVYYHAREIGMALPILEEIVRENPADNPANTYLKRCKNYIATGNYTGTEVLACEINWRNEYETGIAKIDRQHSQLFALISKLHKTVMSENNKSAALSALGILEKSILEHFEFEEDLMKNHFYPFASDHVAQHRSYKNYFSKLNGDIENENANRLYLGLCINLFLASWLLNHTTRDDRHLGRFLIECGALEAH